MAKRIITLCTGVLFLLLSTPAFAQARPATIQLTIYDETNHPLPNVKIAPNPISADTPATTTDASGHATFTIPFDNFNLAYRSFSITREGAAPYHVFFSLWEGAALEHAYSLHPPHTTILHLRGPKGEIIPDQSLFLEQSVSPVSLPHDPLFTQDATYWGSTLAFDHHGDFSWTHSPFASALHITVGNTLREDGHLLASLSSKDVPELTITLSEQAFARVSPTRILQGKLLHADGTPATDWYLASRIQRHTGGGFSGGIVQMIDSYKADTIDHPAADGTFSITNPGSYFGLISPEGFPFLYTLSPEDWPDSPHHLNFTVPEIRRAAKIQFLDLSGKPAPAVPIRPTWMISGSFQWTLDQTSVNGNGVPSAEPWHALTDDNGFLTLPTSWGALVHNYQVGKALPDGTSFTAEYYNAIFSDETRITLKPWPGKGPGETPPTPPVMSHVILNCVDQNGKPANDVQVESFYAPEAGGFSEGAHNRDSAGLHFFVRQSDRTAKLKTVTGIYQPVEQILNLTGAPRQELRVTLQRNPPLSGRVLNTAGQPLPGAQIALSLNGKITGGLGEMRLYATADDQGNFQFPGAPAAGSALAYHTNPITGDFGDYDTESARLPFDAATRTLEFRLIPTTSLTLILPPHYPPLPTNRSLTFHSLADASGTYDSFANALHMQVKPGTYRLDPKELPAFADSADLSLTVKPNQENTVDFRNRPLAPWAAAPLITTALRITESGKPFSGAEVAIFADPVPDTDTEALPTALAFDLSDANGIVHFSAREGQPCVAIARLRGRFLAYQQFSPARNPAPLELPLQPTRTLTIPPRPPSDKSAQLSLENLSSLERRALTRALNIDHLWNAGPGGTSSATLHFTSTPTAQTFDSLPPGLAITIRPDRSPPFRLTIPAGTTPLDITPP